MIGARRITKMPNLPVEEASIRRGGLELRATSIKVLKTKTFESSHPPRRIKARSFPLTLPAQNKLIES